MKTSTRIAKILPIAMVAGCLWAAAPSNALGQFIQPGPYGSIGFRNSFGTYDFYYPSRYQPGANQVVPGSFQSTPFGPTWMGADGQIHGDVYDPSTGERHFFSKRRPRNSSSANRPGTGRPGTGVPSTLGPSTLGPSMMRPPARSYPIGVQRRYR